LAIALAEMAMAAGIGAVLTEAPEDVPAHAHWFGEDQARYLVTVPADKAEAVLARAQDASVPALRVGVTGGDALRMPSERPLHIAALSERFERWLPDYMAGGV
jgi:phosphoribosylformylglycinamidine (FGAM) synthase-like enzyme